MKIIDLALLLYVSVLITRGWLLYCNKNNTISFVGYVAGMLEIEVLKSIIDLRFLKCSNKNACVINMLTVILYLMIIVFLIKTFT